MPQLVQVRREVIDSVLSYSKAFHPDEGILLLKGKNRKGVLTIQEVVIPPLAEHSENSSSFPMFMLPSDVSIIGVAHSHPNGALFPSEEDLNNFYGRVMVLVGYPYRSEVDVAVFDRDGKSLVFNVIP
ncbi:MAG: Mov34/MPN/PAD-1 family protein [Candidatus Bathyarchaeia archaeon]